MAPTPLNAIVRFLLEPTCAACRTTLQRPLDSPVCEDCWSAVPPLTPPLCVVCGDALATSASPQACGRCVETPPSFDAARSAARYDGTMRDIIHAFKYGGRRPLAPTLARMMILTGREWLPTVDAVVPVPLHPWRAFTRGFNQADDLARHVGPPVWRILRRRRLTRPQTGSSRALRRQRAADAYALSRRARWVGRALRGAAVLLVDDVMTTGATLDACGSVLRDAGVRSIYALTIARAVATPPPQLPPPRRPSSARRR